jgi:hypothetical protein
VLLDAAMEAMEAAEGRKRVSPHASSARVSSHEEASHGAQQQQIQQQQQQQQQRECVTGDFCAQEDLNEFIHLLTAAMSSPLSWQLPSSSNTPPNGPTSTRLAHLEAAAGYLELAIGHRAAAAAAASSSSAGASASRGNHHSSVGLYTLNALDP